MSTNASLSQQLPHYTIMFPYACMSLLTIHMWPVLFPSLHFSSVASIHLHQGISSLIPLPYLSLCFGILHILLQTSYAVLLTGIRLCD